VVTQHGCVQSNEKLMRSLVGSPSKGSSLMVSFFTLTLLRMVAVCVKSWPSLVPGLGACALGWLQFRKPLNDRSQGERSMEVIAPKLFSWFESLRSRPSLAATEPH
jgi:hypothetical protein